MNNISRRFVPTRAEHLYIIVILLISFGVYVNTLFNGFVFDDAEQVLENRWIRDIRFIPDIFTSNVWSFKGELEASNYYRPLMHIIYMFNYYLFGLKAWGFHLVNILFHAGVSVLVFIITWQLLEKARENRAGTMAWSLWYRQPALSLLPAFASSLLFATHPVHTEAVAWIAGLPDLSYAFFCLLSLYFYIRTEKELNGMYWLSVMFFAVASLCKEPALMLPFILIGYDVAFSRPGLPASCTLRSASAFSRRYIPYFIVTGAYMVLRLHALGGISPLGRHAVLGPYGQIINVFPLFADYLNKLLLPVNLNAFHVLHPISSIFQPRGIMSLTVTAAFIAVTLAAIKKNGIFFFGLLLIVLPLLPALYIPALGEAAFAERYLYLPSFGFALLVAVGVSRVGERRQRLFAGLVMILILLAAGYSIGTIKRNIVWRNDYSLWVDTIKKSPDSALPRNNLGRVYETMGRTDEAIAEYRAAMAINPAIEMTHNNLGNAYYSKNRIDEAIAEYKTATKLNPAYAKAHFNLGNAYRRQNLIAEAITEYKTALKIKPDFAEAHYNLAAIYYKQNRIDEAMTELSNIRTK